ncbi:phosphotransferase enzyme family protein [Actinoplanes regularis]|uniref:Phosphotransferase enzyme family protein n=1 Tax=Actinoplanes regularis TaxID=52697 RepID=A0A238YGA1_9ACTN|nr:aminoglycoside phosphotransferase family protein [Actinoplanes regularis]GIE85945.1 phosphotransferase [Actinoplanes regularis]SNR69644.1 Phosphotransferase enzyme family protein [Actinoplanes regularis]
MIERETLTGGINEVVRIGDKVHRPTGPWSPRVHDLLRHLASTGFTGAPRFHGVTEDGYEILDFLPGEVSNFPLIPAAVSVPALVSAAELLRAYHDATAGFARSAPRDGWQLPALDPVEVICHGDYAPYNCVLDGDRTAGVFDFDHARPGPRLWDVAYAAYRWAPLTAPGSTDALGDPAEQAARLRLFCDRYALDALSRAALIDTVVVRLHTMVDFMRAQAAAGNAAFAGHLAAGHHLQYLGDADYVQTHRSTFSV